MQCDICQNTPWSFISRGSGRTGRGHYSDSAGRTYGDYDHDNIHYWHAVPPIRGLKALSMEGSYANVSQLEVLPVSEPRQAVRLQSPEQKLHARAAGQQKAHGVGRAADRVELVQPTRN